MTRPLDADLATLDHALTSFAYNQDEALQAHTRLKALLREKDAEIARLERKNDSLYLERQALDHVRVHDNKYLIERAEAAEREVARLRKLIRADHAYKASIGGSPCIRDVCAPAGDTPGKDGAA